MFTIEERQRILDHLKNNDNIYSLSIQLDFHLVLRIGELLVLKWNDIQGDYIHVQSQRLTHYDMNDDLSFTSREFVNVDHIKGNTNEGFRYQPLTPNAKEILERVRATNYDGEYVFMRNGRQLLGDTFNEHLHKHCNELVINGRSSHKIRFTVASILYSSGVPLISLQRLLGHTTTAMTLHY